VESIRVATEPAAEVGEVAADGRLARSQRTRRAIVEALRALHHEGDLRPTAPRVAERAGVSLRTVWQHFDDLETLFAEAGRVDLEIARGLVSRIDPATPLGPRLTEFVAQRARLFEAMAPVWRAAKLQEPFSAQIQRNHQALLDWADGQLEEVFGPDLADVSLPHRGPTRNALHAATSWSTWEFLRAELRLTPDDARGAVRLLLLRLFALDDPKGPPR
jgi:TetR/AcrR family transcriptional regulator, regulator of autoinduction and epiphytic fitness